MKNIKRILCLALSLCMVCLFVACKKETKKATVNKMATELVHADSIGLKQGGKVDNYETMQKTLDEGKSIYLGDGSYYVSKTIKLKNAQIIGSATGRTSLVAKGDYTLIEADGQFVIKDLKMLNSAVDGSEKQGDKVLVSLGKNGGATEGSMIRCVQFAECGTAIYEAKDATPTQGLDIETIEYTKVSYAGMDFQSKGRKNNHIGNVYMGANGSCVTDVAEIGARFCGSEENLKIDQFNVEHFRAEINLLFDGVKNLDVSTIHIEGMDIGKEGSAYIRCNNTSGNLGNVVIYWSRVSYDNCSAIQLGNAKKGGDKLFIESLQFKGVNDPATFHGDWSARGRGTAHIGWRAVDRVDGSKNEYRIELDNYVPFTYQSDWNFLKTFPCDDEDVVYLKKGNIKQYGTTAERPTDCLCKGYSTYYDTTLGQLLVYNGTDWVPYIEAEVKVSEK